MKAFFRANRSTRSRAYECGWHVRLGPHEPSISSLAYTSRVELLGADRLLERAAHDGQEPDARSRAGAACAASIEEYATGRFTKQQVLEQTRAWGLTNRRNRPLTSQAIGVLLSNQVYAGIMDVPEYGVRGKRGDFEPLISEGLFYRVQAVLSGRLPKTTPKQRDHPDFPLRAFVWHDHPTRLHRDAADLDLGHLRWRIANATPEPDFK